MVRVVGIEPTLREERDFESRASTNSATPAYQSGSPIEQSFLSDYSFMRFFVMSSQIRCARA